MPYVLDASSIINLHNAAMLDALCAIKDRGFLISPLVLGECVAGCADKLMALRADGCVKFVSDDLIPADRFLELLAERDLGEGETESIVICREAGYAFCCDDRKARNLATELLAKENVVGSMTILRWCVEVDAISCDEAFRKFCQMKAKGGFLPNASQQFFCEEKASC